MKQILYTVTLIALIAFTTGCEYEDVLRYDPNRAGIEFIPAALTTPVTNINSQTFSFRTLPAGVTESFVAIPFAIVGFAKPYERHAVFSVVADSTTAEASQYEIVSAIVPADAYRGWMFVRVINDRGLNFRDVHIRFRTEQAGDFMAPSQRGNIFNYYILRLTNNLPRPPEWGLSSGTVNERLGAYSTAFYSFIIQATGYERFPFPSSGISIGGEQWTPSYAFMFLLTVINALEELNLEREAEGLGPLLHDDGHAAGHPIIVGNRYANLL